MSEHTGVTSATFGPVVAAGLVAALLVVAPTPATATSSPGGDPPPPPAEGGSPEDEPVLQPAGDDEVVILGTDEQVDQPVDPEAVERDETGDRSGPLGSAELGPVGALGVTLLGLLSLALAGISATRLRRMLYAWWSPAAPREADVDPGRVPPTMSFSLIVADRGDEEGFGRTLEHLAAFDHPNVEILAVVGHNQPRARELAVAAAYRQPHRIRVVVDRAFRRNEPRALNAGLAECRGDVIGVFRPGDEVRPGILRHVEATLEATGADVVQSGVLLTAERPSWFSIRRIVESYFWFRSRLHHHARQRFTPLATTSMFVRADVLRDAGGWDEDAVAEGCELGVRLSVAGVPVAVTWDPEVLTRAAVPQSARALTRQQTQWIQGFLQTLHVGAWRELPARRQRVLARATLAMPFLEAVAGAAILALATVVVAAGAPPPIVLFACLPLIPAVTTVVVELAGAGELHQTVGVRIGARDRLLLLLGAIPYQFLLAAAALRALVRERRGKPSGDTASQASGSSADAGAGADGDRTGRPQLAQRAAGQRGGIDVATRAGAVDR
ncbi:MAG TPA: glycosyltransferase family 2 protein [Acidimicrobiales bacterium]|nr:glycosyltransferase family 2 protein [Acidimicrobiales bacterium]